MDIVERTEGFTSFNLVDQKTIEGVPAADIIQIHSVTRDATGNYYLSDEFNHRIVALDPAGKCIKAFGRQGNGRGEFWYPRGIAIVEFEGDPHLVVCDAWNHRIQRFDLDGNFKGVFGSIGDGGDQFNEPVAVIPENGGKIWILDRCNHRIKLCSIGGETISIIGKHLTSVDEDRMNDPAEIYLGNAGNQSPVFGLNYPMDFAIDVNGHFIVADTNNSRVCVIRKNGEIAKFINLKGDKPPYCFPDSVTTFSSGYVLMGGINMPFQIMDINRSWLSNRAQIGTYDPMSNPTILRDESGNVDTITLFDGRKGMMSKYSMAHSSIDDARPTLPLTLDSEEVSSIWVNRAGGDWFEYLFQEPEREQNCDLIKSYYKTCRDQAMYASKELSDIESEYLKLLVEFHELNYQEKKNKLEGRSTDNSDPDIQGKIISIRLKERRRLELRRILIRNIAWIIESVNITSDELSKGNFSSEKEEILGLLKDGYAERIQNFIKTLEFLENQVEDINDFNITLFLHGCAGLIILNDHLAYFRKALVMLGTEPVKIAHYHQKLPLWLEPFANIQMGGISSLDIRIVDILLLLCKERRLLTSAIKVCQYGASRNRENEARYNLELASIYLEMDDVDIAYDLLNKEVRKVPNEQGYYLHKGSLFSTIYHFNEALALYRRAGELDNREIVDCQIAWLYTNKGDNDKAISIFRPLFNKDNIDPALQENIKLGYATTLLLRGNVKSAYEFVMSNDFKENSIQKSLLEVDILCNLGERRQSTVILESLLEKHSLTPSLVILVEQNLAFDKALAGDKEGFMGMFSVLQNNHSLDSLNMNVVRAYAMGLRLIGEFSQSVSLSSARTGFVRPIHTIAIERLIAACGMRIENDIEEAKQFLRDLIAKAPYWQGRTYYNDTQASLLEEAFGIINIIMRESESNIEIEWRDNNVCHYNAYKVNPA